MSSKSLLDSKSQESLAKERVEKAKTRLAKCINMLETTVEELKWSCSSMNWNDEVAFQIEEGMLKLGESLATLTNWYEDEEITNE